MNSLYIDRRGVTLKAEKDYLDLFLNGKKQQSIPYKLMDRVIIHSDIPLSCNLLLKLANAGISMLILNRRSYANSAQVNAVKSKQASLRIAQFRLAQQDDQSHSIAQAIVRMKLISQQRLLQHYRRQRPDKRFQLSKSIDVIQSARAKLGDAASKQSLLGLEGAAAAAYFRAYTQLFASRLGFDKRQKRPPKDPVNACLSLAYTLVYHRIGDLLDSLNLDRDIGFLHASGYNGIALCCDLIEPLRASIDAWVQQMFVRRLLRAEHFSSGDVKTGCRLGKAGRAIFYAEFETQLAPALQRKSRQLTAWLIARIGGPGTTPSIIKPQYRDLFDDQAA